MASIDSGYCRIDQTPDPELYVHRLDRVGAHPFWRTIKELTYELLNARPGCRLLDVGCGTGEDARALAHRVGRTGQVVGVDRSATMIHEAWKRAEGTELPVQFAQEDACCLGFPDAAFDGCRAERILQHLDQPAQALQEMVRVTRAGGRLVAVEPDYGTLTIQGGDCRIAQKIREGRCRHFRSARIGLQLPLLFQRLRLSVVQVQARLLSSTGFGADEPLLRKYISGAQAAHLISASEGERWLEDLSAAAASEQYCQTLAVFVVSGTKL